MEFVKKFTQPDFQAKNFRLGDILSQGQIVPLHYAPPRRHIVPTDAPSPVTFCPTFSI